MKIKQRRYIIGYLELLWAVSFVIDVNLNKQCDGNDCEEKNGWDNEQYGKTLEIIYWYQWLAELLTFWILHYVVMYISMAKLIMIVCTCNYHCVHLQPLCIIRIVLSYQISWILIYGKDNIMHILLVDYFFDNDLLTSAVHHGLTSPKKNHVHIHISWQSFYETIICQGENIC